jgi:hypothetical protein
MQEEIGKNIDPLEMLRLKNDAEEYDLRGGNG